MKLLLVLNRRPYDGTDVTWNVLRMVDKALDAGIAVRIFLMNDALDLARDGLEVNDDYDLQKMFVETIAKGAEARLCRTCISRCGIEEGKLRSEVAIATMPDLGEWIGDSDQVMTF